MEEEKEEEEEEQEEQEEKEEEKEKEEKEEEVEWSGGHNKPVPAANPSRPLLLPEGTATHFLFLKIFLFHIAVTFPTSDLRRFVLIGQDGLLEGGGEGHAGWRLGQGDQGSDHCLHPRAVKCALSLSSQIILNSSAAHKSQENGSKLIKFESSFVWPASPASGH